MKIGYVVESWCSFPCICERVTVVQIYATKSPQAEIDVTTHIYFFALIAPSRYFAIIMQCC